MLASSALNNLFVTYHLDFYLTVVRLRPAYFYIGHGVFMVWNACNDVLFGWLSDTLPIARGARRSRLPAIRYGGALWALAFLLSWFPWSCTFYNSFASSSSVFPFFSASFSSEGAPLTADESAAPLWLNGINFTLNLCVYDAMLTLVEVNHHALLAEISVDSRERA